MTRVVVSCSVDQIPTACKVQVELDGDVLGQSESLNADDKQGSFYQWIEAVTWQGRVDSSQLTIKILAADGSTVASHQFDYASTLHKRVAAVPLENDAIMAVHIKERPDTPDAPNCVPAGSQLKLRLSAHSLVNTRRGLGLIRKSDPFYEISLQNGTILYKSETIPDELNPDWIVTHISNVEGLTMNTPMKIAVYDEENGDKRNGMGKVTLTFEELLQKRKLVLQKEGQDCGAIFLREASLVDMNDTAFKSDRPGPMTVLNPTQPGELPSVAKLKLQLSGCNLENTRRGLGLIRKSDPFYVISLEDGTVLYKSEIIISDLDPDWKATQVSVTTTSSMKISVYDMEDEDKLNSMGEVKLTFQELLLLREVVLYKDNQSCGKIFLCEATLLGVELGAEKGSKSNGERAGLLIWATQAVKSHTAVSIADSVLAKAKAESEISQTAVKEAESTFGEAETTMVQWRNRAKAAAVHSENCAGWLEVELGAVDLPNLDIEIGFFRDLSDPVFDVYTSSGEAVYESEVVENNLSPVWKPFELDLAKACEGRLDSALRIKVSDSDRGGKKKKYIGEIHVSASDLIAAAEKADQIPLQKGGKPTKGSFAVKRAELRDFVNWKEERELCKKELSAAQLVVDSAHKCLENAKHGLLSAQQAIQSAESCLSAAKKAETEAVSMLESMLQKMSIQEPE